MIVAIVGAESTGKSTLADEQASIADAQAAAIDAAAATHDVVIADTTPLMTAVYSRMLFGDDTLVPSAIAFQRRCALTLLTALDLPWQADGLQRDGEHVREPVDDTLRHLLSANGLPWATICGSGPRRAEAALASVRPWLPGARHGSLARPAAADPAAEATTVWTCWCEEAACQRLARP